MAETVRIQGAAERRSAVARLLGFSPPSSEAAPWFNGSIGEWSAGDPAPAFERLAAEVVSATRWRALVVVAAVVGDVGATAAVSSSLFSSMG